MSAIAFPTALHEQVADEARAFFADRPGVHAVLVTASCARGMAESESDLDMAVLIDPEDGERLEREWADHREQSDTIGRLVDSSGFSALHLDLIDGIYEPTVWDDGGGPDGFELDVGNHVAYAVPDLGRRRPVRRSQDALAALLRRRAPRPASDDGPRRGAARPRFRPLLRPAGAVLPSLRPRL